MSDISTTVEYVVDGVRLAGLICPTTALSSVIPAGI
jgi:hypothetical protein